MVGLPALEFGLADRGRLAVGKAADLVLFDSDEVLDTATSDAPMTPSRGILKVWVNGRSVWRDGGPTDARPGWALRLQSLSLPMLPNSMNDSKNGECHRRWHLGRAGDRDRASGVRLP